MTTLLAPEMEAVTKHRSDSAAVQAASRRGVIAGKTLDPWSRRLEISHQPTQSGRGDRFWRSETGVLTPTLDIAAQGLMAATAEPSERARHVQLIYYGLLIAPKLL